MSFLNNCNQYTNMNNNLQLLLNGDDYEIDDNYEVIIIGGGHAGIEAAFATSKMKCRTLLLTYNLNTIGEMFCNPAIGGIGKGHLVKEIDAMGGLMAHAADHSGIQFKILNTSRGRAVRSTRAQIDKHLYKKYIQAVLKKQNHLTILEAIVDELIIYNKKVHGVIFYSQKLQRKKTFAKSIILSTGTFLNGKIHIGMNTYSNKKIGNLELIPTTNLSKQLKNIGYQIKRLKTGTSPRIEKNSINFSSLALEHSDNPVPVFSFFGSSKEHPQQIPCYITHTNNKTHKIIYNNLHNSPLFTNKIKGIGPRYCPSIEDKIVKFPHCDSHQIFLEPEGLNASEIYLNGISTSLPINIQAEIIHSIQGLENAEITKPGYAIEYNFLDPRHLKLTLESKLIEGLFCAGQINGTTGYEEAAAQGLLAGINAAQFVKNNTTWFPTRDQAYIGVLIDDLCTQGIDEPYRMFTSRAEYRLLLREGNADLRLTEIAKKFCLIDDQCWDIFCKRKKDIYDEFQKIKNIWIYPSGKNKEQLNILLGVPLKHKINIIDLLSRPEVNFKKLIDIGVFTSTVSNQILEEIEIEIKYKGYIHRQKNEVLRYSRNENLFLPNMNFSCVPGLSTEAIEKLNHYQPTSIGQASRIAGITPSSISILLIWLKKNNFMFCST